MAELDPNTPIGQSDKIFGALADYFLNVASSARDGSEYPTLSDALSGIDYTELHRMARNRVTAGSSMATGAAIEATAMAAAVLREYGIRVKNKAAYYGDHASESLVESDMYTAMQLNFASYLRGGHSQGATP